MSANERLRSDAIRHSIYMERVKRGEQREIRELLDESLLDVQAKIEVRLRQIQDRGYDLGPKSTERLQRLEREIREIIREQMGETRNVVESRLENLGRHEVEWQAKRIEGELAGVIDLTRPSATQIRSAILHRPVDGEPLRAWWSNLADSAQERIMRDIRLGIVQGETVTDIRRRVVGTDVFPGSFQKIRRDADTVIRTAINHVNTHAREMTYQENQELVTGVQYVATLDSRTTVLCAGLDGKVFPIDEGPRPPQHPNCRSTTVPVLKTWKEMGIDAEEISEGTRASVDGQVPERMTYQAWLKRQPASVQRDVLGRTRADLFRKGELELDSFVDDSGRVMTLEQLREVEGVNV